MRNDTTYISLFVLPIAAAVGAGTIIYCALNFRIRSSLESVIYATIALLAIYSLLVLTSSAARRTPWIVLLSVIAATVGLGGSLAALLVDFERSQTSFQYRGIRWATPRLLWTIIGLGWLVGSTACFVALVKNARLNRRYNFVRWFTGVVLVCLASAIGLCIPRPIPLFLDEDLISRIIIVLGSCSVLGLFTVLVLARATQMENRQELMVDCDEITLHCPRCQQEQRVRIGESCCKNCMLEFSIQIRENKCEKCGYALYRLESSSCPECGTPILKNPPEPV